MSYNEFFCPMDWESLTLRKAEKEGHRNLPQSRRSDESTRSASG